MRRLLINAIILLSGLLIPAMGIAQESVGPKHEKGVYALKMSPNGKWIGSMAGDASIYEVATGENIYYEGCFLGLGNAVADNGMAVGNSNDIGVLMYNKKTIYPAPLEKYWFCDINAITPDASRIAGIVNSTQRGMPDFVPFVAPVDEQGNVGAPVMLTIPERDFFGSIPQYITAVWMSDDGKTVVGQVQDMRGMYSYPIYFKEDSNGNWSYGLPSQSLFNPTGIEISQNPWMSEPSFPEPSDYMSGNLKVAYLEAFELYSTGSGPMPNPQDYMSEKQFEDYADAVDYYNNWYDNNEKSIREYYVQYLKVLQTSPSFSANDMGMHPSGDYFMIHGGVENEEGDMIGMIFKFNTFNEDYATISAPSGEFFPYQILSNGTLLITRGKAAIPTSYLMLPGSDKFITMQEYFQASQPEISEWLDENVPGGTGVVLVNNDMTLFTGALLPDQLADYDWEFSDFYYSTYFITLDTAGVETLAIENVPDSFKVYDLNGVKVLETKDCSQIQSLPKGIYIINGKKTILK